MNMVSPAYAQSAYASGVVFAVQARYAQSAKDAAAKSASVKEVADAVKKARQDVIDFKRQLDEANEKQKQFRKMLEDMTAARQAAKPKPPPPKDTTGPLAQKLVAALDPMEVRGVMMEAGRALASLQIAAASASAKDKGKIAALIRKVQKLLDRADRKMDDLQREAQLSSRQRRATADNQTQRAQQLKDELRNRIKARQNREQEYLRSASRDYLEHAARNTGAPLPGAQNEKLDPATEAQIEAMAEAQVAAETPAGVDIAMDAGGEVVSGGSEEAFAGSGGEGAAVEGGGEIADSVAAAE